MLNLIKPPRLIEGDKVAAVCLSSGMGEALWWRYKQGKARLEEHFGLRVVEMPHTMKSDGYLHEHPEARAADLMEAFSDPSIKAVISCIGGSDSIRLLPYVDLDVLRNHPKIFMGYSDSTAVHFMCMKAGLSSFYGPAVLTDFAENVKMSEYTAEAVRRALFSGDPIGPVKPSAVYTSQYLEWAEENKNTAREFLPNTPYEGTGGRAEGPLMGGCLEVMEMLRGTSLFPPLEAFDGAILFFETCEYLPPPWLIENALRCYGMMGILGRISGMLWAKPMGGVYEEEYKAAVRGVLNEFGQGELPVLFNGSFGHNEPKTVLPYGARAEINCEAHSFTILENGVV